MQPRFPVLRSLLTALILALIVAAAVAMVARLTLPEYRDRVAMETPAGAAEVAAATTAIESEVADAGADTLAAVVDSPAAAGDSTVAAITDSTAAAAPVGEAGSVAPGSTPTRAPSMWQGVVPQDLNEVTTAPERWIVVAAFVGTFITALLTALFAVRGSVPRVEEEGPVHRRSDAVQLLAVLQREGRLVDFLQEEIEPYTDAQIGAAVRAVHAGCRQALSEHMTLGPVDDSAEGAKVTVEKGFDPSAIRLTGNVAGDPPFEGALRHRGWRATELSLPTDARGQDPEIVAPAEVEIS